MAINFSSITVSDDTLRIDASRVYLVKIVDDISRKFFHKKGVLEDEVKRELSKRLGENREFTKHFFLGHGDYDPVKGWEWASVADVLDGMKNFGLLEVVRINPVKYRITPKGEKDLGEKADWFSKYLFS